MLMTSIVLIILAAALLYWYKKNNPAKTVTHSRQKTKSLSQHEKLQKIISSGKYWGLKIIPSKSKQCCPTVLKLENKPFPINSVPTLPLQGCTQNHCYCQHTGLLEKRRDNSSRRLKSDRREDIRFEETADRRSHSDRRSATWVNHE